MAGIPSKSGVSPTIERELVWWLAKGLGTDAAAHKAGLPSTAALYKYKRTKAFADDLREALRDRLGTELAPKAVKILDEIMSDPLVNPRVRVDAAKAILDRGGFTAAPPAPPALSDEGLSTYSRAELMAIVAEGERKAAIEGATDAEVEVAFDIEALCS
jgi:hypothetical protein